MCGRFVISSDLDEWSEFFGVDEVRTEALAPSWNVAPTDPVYAVAGHEGERLLGSFRWGLIPHYAKHRRAIHINARVETVAEKPPFRSSFARRRCLIGADGFYEWRREPDGSKRPYYIQEADAKTAFAGIWTRWTDPESKERWTTCSILTTTASPAVEDVHDRMPVMLAPLLWDDWLDEDEQDPNVLLSILDANPPPSLRLSEVSTLVNSVRNNDAGLVEPISL